METYTTLIKPITNQRAIWEIIHKERAVQNESTWGLSQLKVNGVNETDAKKIADRLNTDFVNVADETHKNKYSYKTA